MYLLLFHSVFFRVGYFQKGLFLFVQIYTLKFKSGRGVPGAGVTGGFEPLDMVLGVTLGSIVRIVSSEPSLQP